jgi:hypothetical protein
MIHNCVKSERIMSQTLEAVIKTDGKVELLQPLKLEAPRRALVTVLDDEPTDRSALEVGYRDMAQDEEREAEALEWSEATIGDVADEPR